MSSDTDQMIVNIDKWVDKAKHDPEAYLERQATEIFLTALGTTPPCCDKFFLKGGLLMGIAYNSPRQTVDIDYSTIIEPNPEVIKDIREALDKAFPVTAVRLAYTEIICKIQTIKFFPREEGFDEFKAPAFKITIGYAKKGSPQERRLQEGKSSKVLHADVSFKEPIGGIQILRLGEGGSEIPAYSLNDVIAEKYRSLLQQEVRRRYRRQDVYDLDMLINQFSFDDEELKEILSTLLEKSHARNIHPDINSLQQEEIIARAKSEWETLKLEIGELPDFDACFDKVNVFYRALPWQA
tara:strand:- start:975 stop:1862 length:888 start_codon:yes stop_codon:yes gene_type:complete